MNPFKDHTPEMVQAHNRRIAEGKSNVNPSNHPRPESLRSSQPQCPERVPLVSPLPRETKSGPRFEIRFHIYAVRPCDWDNYSIKELQDMVVHAGLLPDDNWTALSCGTIFTNKVKKKADERTVIEIHELPASI